MSKFDIIIAGAGAAGLSLAYYLSKSIWFDKKILLLDKDNKQSNDRTWCFWSEKTPEFLCAKKIYWENIYFSGTMSEKKSAIAPYRYYYIKGLDFYEEMRAELSKFKNITWKQETIKSIQDDGFAAKVITDQDTYSAQWVFNSIAQFSKDFPPETDYVKQYFKGYFIETTQDSFDTETVTLMDFSITKNDEIQFFYVLPFSKRRALVECTVFATQLQNPENYRAVIEQYIKDKLLITNFSIIDEEKGMIPMTTKPIPLRTSEHIFHIGTAGGMTKASSGYTFQNIQLFCKKLMDNWKKDFQQIEFDKMPTPSRFRFYDSLLLHIIKKRPQEFQNIMENLFLKNNTPLIMRFLSEKSSLLDEMHLFLNLPWRPFIKALYETIFYKFFSKPDTKSWSGLPLGDTSHP